MSYVIEGILLFIVGVQLNAYERLPELSWQEVLKKINQTELRVSKGSEKVYGYAKGIPLLYIDMCSAFVAEHPFTQKSLAFTAVHCMSSPEHFSETARNSASFFGLENYLDPNHFSMDSKNMDISYSIASDIYASEIPNVDDFEKSHVFKVADDLPERAEIVYIEGYNMTLIPYVTAWTTSTKIACYYMGKQIDYYKIGLLKKYPRYTITDYLYCPKEPDDLRGMSGGPVVNEAGEVIGMSIRALGASNFSNVDYTIVTFAAITKKEYAYSEYPEDFVPRKNGRRNYFNVTALSSQKEGSKLKIFAGNLYEVRAKFNEDLLDGVTSIVTKKGGLIDRFHHFDRGRVVRSKVIGSDVVYLNYIGDE